MSTKDRIKESIMTLLAILLLASTITFLGANVFKSPQRAKIIQLNNSWTISNADSSYTADDLSTVNTGVINKGETLTISHDLHDYNIFPASINFKTILSSVNVYLDDTLIYSFGDSYVENNQMLPKIQHFVALPKDYPGKTLSIEITGQENNAFSGLSDVILGNQEDLARFFPQKNRLPLCIGVFLVYFGFVLMIASPFFSLGNNPDYSIALSGLVSTLMGAYILAFNDLFWMFTDQPAFYTFIEYFSLYTIPAAILAYLTAAKQIPNRKIGTALWIINLGFSVITTFLHVLNIIHICHFVSVLHLIALTEGLFVIVSLIITMIRRHKANATLRQSLSTAILILGLILFLVCSIIDIIKYNIVKFAAGEAATNIDFMTVGSLIFIFSLVMNYFFHCIEYISESDIQQKLEGLAYTDSLTGLANRSKCELSLAELSGDYTIISIDLDYLKYTNDNYGHIVGDKLLSGFASILTNSFTDAYLIGRMGGDEFIAILPFVDESRTERELACFTDLMKYRNTLETNIKYSASYGTATSKDKAVAKNLTAQNVYLLADTRMYQMKKSHHRQSLGRLYNDLIGNMEKEGGEDNEK